MPGLCSRWFVSLFAAVWLLYPSQNFVYPIGMPPSARHLSWYSCHRSFKVTPVRFSS